MLSVSIVCYNTDCEELGRCLDSLKTSIVSTIYIVDNSSQSYIQDFCATHKNVEYIPSKNVGYGAGHNIAIRKAIENNEEYHLVLNSDVYFEPDTLDKLVEYLDSNKDVAQVQPRITYPDGTLQYTCRLLPTPLDLIFRRFLPKCVIEHRNNRYILAHYSHNTTLNIAYHQGSFMLFRTSCFKDVGLFDERFFMYPEDIDITRRMHSKYRTMYWPNVSVVHAHRAASYKSTRMLKIHIVNMVKYFNKWGWFFDSERRKVNREILKETNYSK